MLLSRLLPIISYFNSLFCDSGFHCTTKAQAVK